MAQEESFDTRPEEIRNHLLDAILKQAQSPGNATAMLLELAQAYQAVMSTPLPEPPKPKRVIPPPVIA